MADVPGDPDAVVRSLVRHLPGLHPTRVIPLGAGLDNTAFEVDGVLVVRYRRDRDVDARAAAVQREARLLELLQDVSPLPVPRVRFALPEVGCLGYAKLPGRPLLERPRRTLPAGAAIIAPALGAFLAALHSVPHPWLHDLVEVDAPTPSAWRDEAMHSYRKVAGDVPATHRREVEAFLADEPPAAPISPTFSHNDLGIEHVLVGDGSWSVTGVIDWTDAAIIDSAYDFGLLLRDLGRPALRGAADAYRAAGRDASALYKRALFYARCALLEDLAYGQQTGRGKYTEKSRAALPWLFGTAR